MTHLLPGGGVPWVHEARSPVPPRLPLFANPRSVRHLETVAAGSTDYVAPQTRGRPGCRCRQGTCYWFVASGTPMGWRGGCLAVGLVRGSVCHYCLGRCSAVFVCARRSRPVLVVGAGASSCVSPAHASLSPRSPRCVWRVVPSRCPLPSPASTPFHAVCAFRGLGPVALLVFPACPLRVCALALPPGPRTSSLPRPVWRTHPLWFLYRAPVGPFHAVGPPPRFLPRSRAPSGLPWGGAARSLFPGTWLWVVCPLVGGPGWGGPGGGGLCAAPPRGRGWRAPRGGGSPCLRPSLCLHWAGTKAGAIGVAQLMEGVLSIPLRLVSAC